jgi:hypothetical protein
MGSEKTYRQGQGCNIPVAAAAIVGVSAVAASLGLVSRVTNLFQVRWFLFMVTTSYVVFVRNKYTLEHQLLMKEDFSLIYLYFQL